mmetsp:Transcript_12218/g.37589  ORF Transcript_12218/g.37589 Transcript_12218/m.37589 type:complete len:235 (-) Transcript_12218:925-1629(-)
MLAGRDARTSGHPRDFNRWRHPISGGRCDGRRRKSRIDRGPAATTGRLRLLRQRRRLRAKRRRGRAAERRRGGPDAQAQAEPARRRRRVEHVTKSGRTRQNFIASRAGGTAGPLPRIREPRRARAGAVRLALPAHKLPHEQSPAGDARVAVLRGGRRRGRKAADPAVRALRHELAPRTSDRRSGKLHVRGLDLPHGAGRDERVAAALRVCVRGPRRGDSITRGASVGLRPDVFK